MYNVVTTMDPAATGVKAIGQAMGGGIQPGSLVVIEGDSGSGKSVLSQHLAYSVLMSGKPVAYYVTDTDCEDLIHQMESFNMQVRHQYMIDLLRVYSIDSIGAMLNIDLVLKELIDHMKDLPQRFSTVVIDCLTPFMNNTSLSFKADVFLAFKEMCGENRSIVLVAHSHIFEKVTHFRVFSMSDYYLRTSTSNRIILPGLVDERAIKTLEVYKINGVELPESEKIEFEIKPKVGIQILPFCKIKV